MIGALLVMVDRTDGALLRAERTRFAEALHEAQKVEAINNFAGSLAHELGNLLHPLAAYARMLAADPDHPQRADYAGKINQTALIAGRLVRRTLGLARTDAPEAAAIDIGEMVDEIMVFARDLAPQGLDYVFSRPSAAVPAGVRAGELRQVLLNLLNNAAEVMHYRGRITLELAADVPRPADAAIGLGGAERFCRITVRDTGPGIPETVRARIFEPFFTTKPDGRGTGLGLAVVQGLALRWGGGVTVESSPAGAAFHVWIPRSSVAESVGPAAP
jgi:signal transduction histidine kinase